MLGIRLSVKIKTRYCIRPLKCLKLEPGWIRLSCVHTNKQWYKIEDAILYPPCVLTKPLSLLVSAALLPN